MGLSMLLNHILARLTAEADEIGEDCGHGTRTQACLVLRVHGEDICLNAPKALKILETCMKESAKARERWTASSTMQLGSGHDFGCQWVSMADRDGSRWK